MSLLVRLAAAAAALCFGQASAADGGTRLDAELAAGWESSSSPLLRLSPDGALIQIDGLSRLSGVVSRLAVNGHRDWALAEPFRLSLSTHGEMRWSPSSSLNLGALLVEAGLRWQVATGSVGLSPSRLVLVVANQSFRTADATRLDWTEVDPQGGLRSVRIEAGRYRHAASYGDLDADVWSLSTNRRWKLERQGIDSVELSGGVRAERNRQGLADLSNRGAHVAADVGWKMAGADCSLNVMFQQSGFRAAGPDGLGVRHDRFSAVDFSAEWPLGTTTAVRLSVASSINRARPAIYENRRRGAELTLVGHL